MARVGSNCDLGGQHDTDIMSKVKEELEENDNAGRCRPLHNTKNESLPQVKRVMRYSDHGVIKWRTANGGKTTRLAFQKASKLAHDTSSRTANPSAERESVGKADERRNQPEQTLATVLSDIAPSCSEVGEKSNCIGMESPCSRCFNSLPHMRRSLGRLEHRLDAVMVMVRQLAASQPPLSTPIAPKVGVRPSFTVVATASPARPLHGQGTKLVASRPLLLPPNRLPTRVSTSGPVLTSSAGRLRDKDSFLVKMMAKTILLYNGCSFTVEELIRGGTNAVRAVGLPQVYEVLGMLMKDGLVHKVDESVGTRDPECIFEKEVDPSRLLALSSYGVPLDKYTSSCT